MRTKVIQTNFTGGEISETLAGRTELEKYYKSCATAENVVIMPHGGLKRRPGLARIAGSHIDKYCRLESFEFSTTQKYLIVVATDLIHIYKDGAQVATVTSPFTTTAMVNEFDFVQSADTMIFVHEDLQPRKLVRGSTDSSWTISSIEFTNIPQYKFNHNYTNTGTTQTVTVQIGETVYNNDGNSTNGEDVTYYKALTVRTSIDLSTEDFTNLTNWANLGTSGEEDTWSATRGYPRTATFHQNRLWFGGSKSKISTVWGSVVNDFFNFDTGTGLADEALFDTLDTDQFNKIEGIFSGRNLQVFTTGGEFYNPAKVITPEDSSWLMQTNYGSKRIRPISIDGATMYVSRSGKSIRQFLYSFQEDAYLSVNALLMAEHLATGIKTIDSQRGTLDNVSDFVYVIDDSGKCLVLNTMRSEDILGWTKWTTQGLFKDCAVLGDEVYFLVLRDGDYYIEKLTPNTYTDHNTTKSGTDFTTVSTSETGSVLTMEHKVVTDGAVQNDATPNGSGVITLPRPADYAEVGLGYTVTITTMPINFQDRDGMTVNNKKRVLKTKLRVYNTRGAFIQGALLQDRRFPIILNQNPDPYTGVLEISHLGFSRINSVEVTQSDPLPLHILQIESECES